MIETITLALISDDDKILPLSHKDANTDTNIELETATLFTKILSFNNAIEDEEIRRAEKFHFALKLRNYFGEIKENAIG